MRTATGFIIGAAVCFGFLAHEPKMSLLGAVALLIAVALEFEGEDL